MKFEEHCAESFVMFGEPFEHKALVFRRITLMFHIPERDHY
ncbi:MAG TPA: hypothetical protein PK293_16255 [Spirochaetota bacterium]|nr:hypothetical protein [Spirochaetota bacterium]